MARTRFDLPTREITPRGLYLRRRELLALGAAGAGALLLARGAGALSKPPPGKPQALANVKESPLSTRDEKITPYQDVTSYNNFYEFGTAKDDPSHNAGSLRPRPWQVRFEGEIKKPRTVDLEELLRRFPLEERVYRMRCVEAWSMVIPWVGFPLADLIKWL